MIASNLPPLAALPVMRRPRDLHGRGWGFAKGLSGVPVAGGETPILPYGQSDQKNFEPSRLVEQVSPLGIAFLRL
jgi:hypothetical protein